MATYTKTVDPNGGADYSSLSAWEAGEQTLYVSGDIAIADCRRTGPTKDTAGVTISGWTAGVVPKIIVNPTYRHEGKWADQRTDGKYIYILDTVTNSSINNDIAQLEVVGLLVAGTRNTTGAHYVVQSNPVSSYALFDRCMFRAYSFNGATASGAYVVAAGSELRIVNSVIIDCSKGIYNSYRTVRAYNNTFYNCTTAISHPGGTLTARNNIFQGCGTDISSASGVSATYCATTNDGTKGISGATNRISQTFGFVDAVALDFHLTAGDTGARGFGVDLSADAIYAFAIDIDGQARSAPWDIGADQYVSAGGGTPWSITHDLRAVISTARTTQHDTATQISTALSTVADSLALVSTTLSTQVDTAVAISTTRTTGHDTRAIVATALVQLHDTRADISSLVGYVVRHDLRTVVSTETATHHDLRAVVSTVVSNTAEALAMVATAVEARHDTRATVATQVTQAADLLASISRQIETTHDTQAIIALASQAASVVFRLAGEMRVFTLPHETRVFRT